MLRRYRGRATAVSANPRKQFLSFMAWAATKSQPMGGTLGYQGIHSTVVIEDIPGRKGVWKQQEAGGPHEGARPASAGLPMTLLQATRAPPKNTPPRGSMRTLL